MSVMNKLESTLWYSIRVPIFQIRTITLEKMRKNLKKHLKMKNKKPVTHLQPWKNRGYFRKITFVWNEYKTKIRTIK